MTQAKEPPMCADDQPAFLLSGAERQGRFVVSCDHASNRVPPFIAGGDLGLAAEDMVRHIAWDPGAAGVSLRLGEALEAPVVLSNFSRLVIDPNRGLADPTLLMKLYDGSIIPANRFAGAEERARRVERLYRPYHDALAQVLAARTAPALVAVHSFTPCLRGRAPRPWHVGVLHSPRDSRLATHFMTHFAQAHPEWVLGDNEPYIGDLPGDSVDRHALACGRPNILIELRNDLIATPEGQAEWAARLAAPLQAALAALGD